MFDLKNDLIKRYKNNIESANQELKYYFAEIRRLKAIIAENKIMLNSLQFSQLSLKELLNKEI